jgi:hypothetical protein
MKRLSLTILAIAIIPLGSFACSTAQADGASPVALNGNNAVNEHGRVVVDYRVPYDLYKPAFARARKDWNNLGRQVDGPMIRKDTNQRRATVVVVMFIDCYGEDRGTVGRYDHGSWPRRIEINYCWFYYMTPDERENALRHEIGHAFEVPHKKVHATMHPTFERIAPHLTRYDRNEYRKRWA